MKTLLITPPPPYPERLGELAYDPGDVIAPPLALAYLGAAIREAGLEVRIFDTILELWPNYRWDDLFEVLQRIDFDVVGISCLATVAYPNSLQLAKMCKQINPNSKVVLGGMFPTFMDTLPFSDSEYVDVVARREGERTVVSLLKAFEQGKNLEEIKGITYSVNGNIKRNPDQRFVEDLDNIQPPAWDMYPGKLLKKISRGLPIMTSRGCPFSCAYCVDKNFWRDESCKIRYHSPSRIVSDISSIVDLGFSSFHVNDDTFTSNHDIVRDVCRLIKKEGIDVDWHVDTRADTVDRKILSDMKTAGCNEVLIGIESGSQEILDRANTHKNVDITRKAIEVLNKLDYSIIGTFVIGLPGETFETFSKTIKFLSSLELDVAGFYPFIPFPGSDIWNNPERFGIKILNRDWVQYLEPFVVAETEALSSQNIQTLVHFARAFAFDHTANRFSRKMGDQNLLYKFRNSYLLKK